MNPLLNKQCQAYSKEEKPMKAEIANELLAYVENWQLNTNNTALSKTFEFKNYYQTIAFVNTVAWVAHQQDHHPDLSVHYNRCHVGFSTHSIGGLTENDFICAARIDQF